VRPHPDRARLLASRGYCIAAITEHMREEGRDVADQEVRAWIDYRLPPQMVTWRGERVTVSSIARVEGIDPKAFSRRVASGMGVDEAIAMGKEPRPAAAVTARQSSAESPWRRYPSCVKARKRA
jgi:hypothetical protein